MGTGLPSSNRPFDETISARITPSCPSEISEMLLRAWQHDTPAIKKLLDAPGKASIQDPETGETPLHAAIRSCGPAANADKESVDKAKATVEELLLWGGIWNDVDDHNETPGCVAFRLGQRELYDMCVLAGVRAELLFGLLDGYQELGSGSEAEADGDVEDRAADEQEPAHAELEYDGAINTLDDCCEQPPELVEPVWPQAEPRFEPPHLDSEETEVNSEKYLRSKLTYSDGKLVDSDGNGVMMAWETEIMRRSVDALLPDAKPGKKILNIGFGMGIIDSMLAATNPAKHHIIEAHEEVLAHIESLGSKFGPTWELSGPVGGAYKVHKGRWQDIVPILLERGEVYDAIYFDTFGEDYSQLRKLFTEYMPGLLEQHGVFGFFNGLGADRRICYDVYTQVVELHLTDAGMDVDWIEVAVDLKGLDETGKGEWEGLKRRYWTMDKYRLPVCTFLG